MADAGNTGIGEAIPKVGTMEEILGLAALATPR
jgi:hypothetical protein